MQSLRKLGRWWRTNRGWFQYKLRHPTSPFHEYYLNQVERRLDDGAVHATLGSRSVENEAFDKSGRRILDVLIGQGLEPKHRVLDYGCGSLRAGRHFIDYLEPEGYTGLDVTDRFFKDGLATLDPAMIEAKRPHLARISEEELDKLAALPPDYIISTGVLIHVPKNEVKDFFLSCLHACSMSTQAYISFQEEDRHNQIGELTWAWPESELHDLLGGLGFASEVVEKQTKGSPAAAPGRSRTLLRVVRKPA